MKKSNIISGLIENRIGYRKWKRIKYLMIAVPFLVYYFMFCYLPLVGWAYSFFNYKVGIPFYRFDMMEFVGLKNYAEVFKGNELPRVLRNTLVMSVGGLLLSPLPMFFAILVNDLKNKRAKKFVQTVTTFPNFISWVIVFGLAQGLFSSNGLLNQLIEMIGLQPFPFGLLGDRDHVWGFQLALQQWKGLGWGAIIYLAAITGIDTELFDAAKVDGANKLQLVRHITIPGMLPSYFVLLLLNISNLLNSGFEQYYVFFNTLTGSKIEVLDYYIYKVGLMEGRLSYSVTAGIIKSFVGIALLFMANSVSKKVRGSSIV